MHPVSRHPILPAALLVVLATAGPARAGFTDATLSAGIIGGQPTWGAQAVDMDGDGDTDFLNPHHFYSSHVFTNDGAGNFTLFGIPQFTSSVRDRHAFLWADVDGDAILDVLCSHGGSGGCACVDDGNELWRGLGGGLYELVPSAGGMADSLGRGRAFSAADVDGDGDLDLYHAKAPLDLSPNSLYRNDGAMTFVDVAPSLGLDEQLGTAAGLFADYDDDGDPDLLVGGDEFARTTVLWRNDGSVFTDVTAAAFGSLPVAAFCDWGDFDNDEDLDVAVCEGKDGFYDSWGEEGTVYWLFANHRFGDDGVDAFWFDTPGEDPPAQFRVMGLLANELIFLGPTGVHPIGQGTVVLTDDYVGAPAFTPGVDYGLYCWRDTPGGTWQVHVSAPPGTFGNFSAKVFSSAGVQNPQASNLEQLVVPPGTAHVYRNDGGTFPDVTASLGITASANPRAVQWVDFDNDGDLDLHQMNRGTVETGNEADILWRNDGATFTPLEGAGWVPGASDHFTDGGVWADFDLDGDPDLVLQEGAGPAFFSFGSPTVYYRNDGANGHWIEVRLGPTLAGGTPVGAKVTCHVGSLRVHRRVRADSWEGFQRPLALHFGVGTATFVDSLVVDWPGGGRQVVGPLGVDRVVAFGEGGSPTGVIPPVPGVAFAGRIAPQPARGVQRLVLTLPRPAHLRVAVFDVAGRRVRTLADDDRAAGTAVLAWDGRDDSGRRVPAGVYFLRGEGEVRFERKSVRIR